METAQAQQTSTHEIQDSHSFTENQRNELIKEIQQNVKELKSLFAELRNPTYPITK